MSNSKAEIRNEQRAASITHGENYAAEMDRAHPELTRLLQAGDIAGRPRLSAAEHSKYAATVAGQVASAAATLGQWLNMPGAVRVAEYARFAAQAAPVLIALKDMLPNRK